MDFLDGGIQCQVLLLLGTIEFREIDAEHQKTELDDHEEEKSTEEENESVSDRREQQSGEQKQGNEKRKKFHFT